MESTACSDSGRESTDTEGQRIRGRRHARQVAEFRPRYVGLPERGLRFLPYAVCRLQRADTVCQSNDDRVSRNISLSGRQKDGATIHLFTGFPGARIQYNAERVLWRKLLGWALDRLQTAECRRRAGPASASRYPGNGFSRHGLRCVSSIESGVQAAL